MACSMAAAGVHNLGEGCSNVAAEGSARKRPRGRPVKVGHFNDDVGPSHFAKVVMSPGLELLPIPEGFRQYVGNVPNTIVLKTNTGCSWMVKLREVERKISMDQGWAGFAIAHEIKIGYFLTFKALKSDVYKVMIFDYSMTEIVNKCLQHDPALAMMEE